MGVHPHRCDFDNFLKCTFIPQVRVPLPRPLLNCSSHIRLAAASLLNVSVPEAAVGYKSQMKRTNTFSLYSRNLLGIVADLLSGRRITYCALFDNSPAHERTQHTSINFCRRCACFPLTKVHYTSHENLISDAFLNY